jgi:hypothetical protein
MKSTNVAQNHDHQWRQAKYQPAAGAAAFDGLEPSTISLGLVRVIDACGVTHLTYQVVTVTTA